MTEKKVALVTGGSRGIGRAIALELAQMGNLVVINCSGSVERANQVVSEIEDAGGEAYVKAWDVSSYQETEAAMKDILKNFGRLDIV